MAGFSKIVMELIVVISYNTACNGCSQAEHIDNYKDLIPKIIPKGGNQEIFKHIIRRTYLHIIRL